MKLLPIRFSVIAKFKLYTLETYHCGKLVSKKLPCESHSKVSRGTQQENINMLIWKCLKGFDFLVICLSCKSQSKISLNPSCPPSPKAELGSQLHLQPSGLSHPAQVLGIRLAWFATWTRTKGPWVMKQRLELEQTFSVKMVKAMAVFLIAPSLSESPITTMTSQLQHENAVTGGFNGLICNLKLTSSLISNQ